MNYAEIKLSNVANGEGVRDCLFVSGCTHHCKGCFNACAWDFSYGEEFTDDVAQGIIDHAKNSYIQGITILGGEPFEPKNQEGVLNFVKKFKEQCPDKDVWCYSGFTLDELVDSSHHSHTEHTLELLSNIDILVDGKFIEELKDITLKFRGSSNQRILNLKEIFAQKLNNSLKM